MTLPRAGRIAPLFAATLLLVQCSCDFWGGASRFLVTEEDERRLGSQFHNDLTTTKQQEFPVSQNAVINNYVDSLGREILSKLSESEGEKPSYDFTFTVIDDTVENAFAVPGGYVYIYTGILKSMKDEAELVGVLGHEIAHITRHHYREQLAKQAVLITAIKLLRGEDGTPLGDAAFGLLVNLAGSKNSRSDEAESDKYGTLYAGKIGVNPTGIATFFGRMQRTPGILKWFSTHPSPDYRVESVQAQVDADPLLDALDKPEFRNEARFKAKIQAAGIVSGFRITEEDERRLGSQFHNDLTTTKQQEFPVSQNAVINNYVDSLGREILSKLSESEGEKPSYDFTFTVIDDTVKNAFAVPGGYVYIYTGILKAMDDEAELVGVLGHEIAHITRHHYREQLAKQAALINAIELLRGDNGAPLGDAAFGLIVNLAGSKNSRSDEAESDKYGTLYAGKIGVNPTGIATFFGRMEATPGILKWISTHPSPPNRVQAVQAQVDADPVLDALDKPEFRNEARFQAKMQAAGIG